VDDCEFLHKNGTSFFIRTFKNCWKQFDVLYKIRVDIGGT